MLEDVTHAVDQCTDVDVIYLDYSKKFDKVPHNKLLKKLCAYGIRDEMPAWNKDFLAGRKHIGSRNVDIRYTINTRQEIIEIESVNSCNKVNGNLGIIFWNLYIYEQRNVH